METRTERVPESPEEKTSLSSLPFESMTRALTENVATLNRANPKKPLASMRKDWAETLEGAEKVDTHVPLDPVVQALEERMVSLRYRKVALDPVVQALEERMVSLRYRKVA